MRSEFRITVGGAAQSASMTLRSPAGGLAPSSDAARLLADELLAAPLKGRRLLNMSCGAGVLSIAAALCGAEVVAADADPAALKTTRGNAALNGVEVKTVLSDGFGQISETDFDIIVADCTPRIDKHRRETNAPNARRLFKLLSACAADRLSEDGVVLAAYAAVDIQDAEWTLMAHWRIVEIRREFWRSDGPAAYDGARPPAAARRPSPTDAADVNGEAFRRARVYMLRSPRGAE